MISGANKEEINSQETFSDLVKSDPSSAYFNVLTQGALASRLALNSIDLSSPKFLEQAGFNPADVPKMRQTWNTSVTFDRREGTVINDLLTALEKTSNDKNRKDEDWGPLVAYGIEFITNPGYAFLRLGLTKKEIANYVQFEAIANSDLIIASSVMANRHLADKHQIGTFIKNLATRSDLCAPIISKLMKMTSK